MTQLLKMQSFTLAYIVVVINDYEIAFDVVTLIQIHNMISLADFQPLSVAKINIFFINNRGFTERHFNDKVHAILIEEVPIQTTLSDGTSFCRLQSLIGLKYIHQPSNFVLNILTLTCNVSA